LFGRFEAPDNEWSPESVPTCGGHPAICPDQLGWQIHPRITEGRRI